MPSRPTHKINAKGQILGRLATQVAVLLRGKNKVTFAPNIDDGDQVVVYNVDGIIVTGRKLETKKYYTHSGYLGSIKEKSLSQIPMTEAFYKAVNGMLPANKLRSRYLKRLKLYAGDVPIRPSQKEK